jgi:sugar lactone lactonase YvrE
MKQHVAAKAGRMRLRVLGASALMVLLAACGDHPPKEDGDDKPKPQPTAITIVAGDATASGSNDGTGTAARFKDPSGIAVDAAGNLYVADRGNYTIRKITPAGVVTTLAGTAGDNRTVNATGSAARFSDPVALAIGPGNVLYVGDDRLVRSVGTAGQVATVAEIRLGSNVDGRSMVLADIAGIAADARGDLIVANGHSVRRIAANGALTMLQGEETLRDTFGTRVFVQRGVAVDSSNNVYVENAGTINRTNSSNFMTQNVLTLLAGTPGQRGSADGTGAAARFEDVVAMAVDPKGNVYAADNVNNLIRRIAPDGVVSTAAGKLKATTLATGALPGSFPNLRGLATDGKGNFYATSGNAIVKITLP